MTRKILAVVLGVTFVVLYLSSFPELEQALAKERLGLICTLVSICSCASPLVALVSVFFNGTFSRRFIWPVWTVHLQSHVLRTKSTETLPFPLILAIFVVCFQWWIYGILINDFYMQVTNLIGTLIGLFQLSLFLVYPSTTKTGILLNDYWLLV